MKDLEGRKALVTGSSAGLGQSMVVKLAERGADIIINYANSRDGAEETADLCRQHDVNVQIVQADVSDEKGCAALAAEAGKGGTLDILINNAGTTKHARDHSDLTALSREDFLDIYAVNVAGPFLMLQACKPLLVAAYEKHGRASAVLNTSSIAGVTGIGSSVAYAASKGALNTMTLSLARALAPAIRVNAVCPGFIGTRWFKDQMSAEQYAQLEAGVAASTPLKAASGPDDIADAALFFVSDAARHVTGEMMIVDAGMHLDYAPAKAR